MTSVFASAMDALFADPNIGVAAIYRSDGGAPVLVRAVVRRPDEVTSFGDARLPELIEAGVHAFKIEGRQRSKSYVRGVVSAFRAAIDDIRAGRQANIADLIALTEGQKQTQGAFETKKWR